MTKHRFPHLSRPQSVFRLVLAITCLFCAFRSVSDAAKCGGGTTTTMVLSSAYAPPRWIMRVDPPAGPGADLRVTAYKLSLSFDPSVMVFQNPATPKFPFSANAMVAAPGVINVTGTGPADPSQISAKDVDIFELAFNSTVLNALAVAPAENFDGVAAPNLPLGWTSMASGAEVAWVTSTTTPFSMPNDAFAPDPDNIGETQLTSPMFAVPALGASLTFKNNYSTEATYDGMVLEISIDSGPYSDILAAGGSFTSGGYNRTISVDYGSPIAGRQAWSGKSGGYINTTVMLPAAAGGHNVQFRWRMVTDNSIAGTGVRIDEVSINIPQPSFTVYANPMTNDYLEGVDPSDPTHTIIHFNADQVAPTTRVFTPGVLPHIWDPNTLYNDGIIGGPGNWNTTSNSWDNLFVDTPWNNGTFSSDFAVFGGNPDTGIVTVTEPILVGGFQFDISGYDIRNAPGGSLMFPNALPALTKIDTNANTATISSPISGGGFTKVGSGTLILAGANTYNGSTIINAGRLLLNNTAGSGTGNSAVTVSNAGSVLGGTGQISGGPVAVNGGAALLAGDGATASGALTIANNFALNPGSIILVALGPAGSHSTLHRSGGAWSFDTNQGITFLNLSAQPGFYDNIITGLASDPGVASWHINSPGFGGTFNYDGVGNVDLNITSVPQPIVVSSAVSRKTHGASGSFDINLPLSGPRGVECRLGQGPGANDHQIVVTFASPVTFDSATVTSGTGSVAGTTGSGTNTITINLTSVPNAQTIMVTLSNVNDGLNAGNVVVPMGLLVGDTTGNGSVSSSDVLQTKAQVGTTATNSNYRQDVSPNGSINATDLALVKSRVGAALPQPAP